MKRIITVQLLALAIGGCENEAPLVLPMPVDPEA